MRPPLFLHGGELRGGDIDDYFKSFKIYAARVQGGLQTIFVHFAPIFQRSKGCNSKLTEYLAEIILLLFLIAIFNNPELNLKTEFPNLDFMINESYREYAQSTSKLIRVLFLFAKNIFDLLKSFLNIFNSSPVIVKDAKLKESFSLLSTIYSYVRPGLKVADKGVGILTLKEKFMYVKDTIFHIFAQSGAKLFRSIHYAVCFVLNIIELVIGNSIHSIFPNAEEMFKGYHSESSVGGFLLEFINARDINKYVDYYRYRKGAKVWKFGGNGIIYKVALKNGVKGNFDDPRLWAPIYWDGTEWRIIVQQLIEHKKRRGSLKSS